MAYVSSTVSCTKARVAAGVILYVLVAAPAFARGLHADRHSDCKHQIAGLEREWRAAQLAGDLPAIDRLLADDYVGINVNGQVNTKAQFLNRIRTHSFLLSRLDMRETKIRVLGEVAIVTVRAAVQGSSGGAPVNGDFRYIRVYHRLPSGAWKITNFEATRIPSHHAERLAVNQAGGSS